MADPLGIGKTGETIAAKYLSSKGYRILERNWRIPTGEIDIICQHGDTVVFVEVKTRIGDLHGKPWEAVTPFKRAKLEKLGTFYVLKKKLQTYKLTVHVVSVVLKPDLKVDRIDHFSDVL